MILAIFIEKLFLKFDFFFKFVANLFPQIRSFRSIN